MIRQQMIEIGRRIAEHHSKGLAVMNGEDLSFILDSERELLRLKGIPANLPEAHDIHCEFGLWRAFWEECGVWNERDLREFFLDVANGIVNQITSEHHSLPLRAAFELAINNELYERLVQFRKKEKGNPNAIKKSKYITTWYLDHVFGGMHNLIIQVLRERVLEVETSIYESDLPLEEVVNTAARYLHMTMDEYNAVMGRLRRDYLRRYYPTIDDIFERSVEGERLFDGDEKQLIREIIAGATVENLDIAAGIRYLSLENVNFKSYIALQCLLAGAINNHGSTVVEREPIRAAIMRSIVNNSDLWEGQMPIKFAKNWLADGISFFDGLEIIESDINHVLLKKENLKRQGYNLINLDYEGGIFEGGKIEGIKGMLANDIVADESIVFVTLNNSARKLGALKTRFGADRQTDLLEAAMSGIGRYDIDKIAEREYRDSIKMLFLGYKLRRKNGQR